MTPTKFVEKWRMQLASGLLATTEKVIKTSAQVDGFETYYGFAHVFERCFSVTATRAWKAHY